MTAGAWALRFGATVSPSGVTFRLWAPRLEAVQLSVCESSPRVLPMESEGGGEFSLFVPGLRAGADYSFVTGDGRQLPDPVSRWQPHGVHGPSRVIDPSEFRWSDQAWAGLPLTEYLIYELHTGTFSPKGDFEGIIPYLPHLRDLGVTAIEVMPVAQFPGRRNWGYDGVGLYAPQSSYGGPHGLKTLVDACHRQKLAVVLDVVYNHLGPEGNYLAEFGPFFTDSYHTPWGQAINYDGRGSDGVRRFFVDNALYWLTEYHIDALRLDAIHGIFDFGACHILQELAGAFHAEAKRLGRLAFVIAESDLNDPRIIRPTEIGGYGMDSQWNDDFHHSLHTAFRADTRGYFADYNGAPALCKAITSGFVYDGQYSRYRDRRHGSSSADRPGEQFVVFTQNHDQIANAMSGIRFATISSAEQQKVAAAVLICSPFIPLLFMGQEYGETAGFYYFTDHGDPALVNAVREGRRSEAGAYLTGAEFVDPQDAATFDRSKLNWALPGKSPHAEILAWYRDLIAVRKQYACLRNCRKDLTTAESDGRGWLLVQRNHPSGCSAILACNFGSEKQAIPFPKNGPGWSRRLWSGSPSYGVIQPEPPDSIDSGALPSIELAGTSAVLYVARSEPG